MSTTPAFWETTLALLDGAESGTRVALVQVAEPGVQPTLEIRLQTAGSDGDWFTQRRIRLAPGQIPDLRLALGCMDTDAQRMAPRQAATDKVIPFVPQRSLAS